MPPPLSSSSRLSAPPVTASPVTASALSASRRSIRSTFVSHLGLHPGDRSSLLVRERSIKAAACEHFALHGAFDPAAAEYLSHSLRGLMSSATPLVLDLRGITTLDEAFLVRLLKLRRELSDFRPVSFQIADNSPVLALICRLGLEERFGLAPARLPLKRIAASTFSSAEKLTAEKSAAEKSAIKEPATREFAAS